jgi:hypothetical protein
LCAAVSGEPGQVPVEIRIRLGFTMAGKHDAGLKA